MIPLSPVTRVGILAKSHLTAATPHLLEISEWLVSRGYTAVFETGTAELMPASNGRLITTQAALASDVDMVVVLGGDGTLLSMADSIGAAGSAIPILGVNFGSLGFLTEITLPELYPSLESVLGGTAQIEERMMLRSRTLRDGVVHADRLALNDVVITKGALSRIIDLEVEIGGRPIMRVRADGLIIGSPTGSTAYNLAAGGPILHPEVDALLLTPIAPHMLTNRPVVVPASSEIRVRPAVNGSNEEMFVTIDGQSGHALQSADEICITRAERPLKLIRASTRTYFDVLRQKLKWSER